MPSFDIVSEIDFQEVNNAITQVKKEMDTRYDFRGGKNELKYDEKEKTITLIGDEDMKLDAMKAMLIQKMSKRGISNKSLEFKEPEDSAGSQRRQAVKIIEGITTEEGKKLIKLIKDQKLKKIQASIQQDQVRVTGPKIDDLQGVIEFLKSNVSHLELQYINFRD